MKCIYSPHFTFFPLSLLQCILGLSYLRSMWCCTIFRPNFLVRCCRIYHCSMCFCRWNTVISIGIHMIWNFVWMWKIFPCMFHNGVQWTHRLVSLTDRKLLVFKVTSCVSCVSYIATLLTIDNGPFLPVKITKMLLMSILRQHNYAAYILVLASFGFFFVLFSTILHKAGFFSLSMLIS